MQFITHCSKAHLCACCYTLVAPLILARTKGKRNNTFHEGHVVQRRSQVKYVSVTRVYQIFHHCSSRSSQYLYLIADTAWTILSFTRTNILQTKSNNRAGRMCNFREAQLQLQFQSQSQEYWCMKVVSSGKWDNKSTNLNSIVILQILIC